MHQVLNQSTLNLLRTMNYFFSKRSRVLIAVGIFGCFLTSIAGIAAVMIFDGWAGSGGFSEFIRRFSVAYPFACLVVIVVFPWMIPFFTEKLN